MIHSSLHLLAPRRRCRAGAQIAFWFLGGAALAGCAAPGAPPDEEAAADVARATQALGASDGDAAASAGEAPAPICVAIRRGVSGAVVDTYLQPLLGAGSNFGGATTLATGGGQEALLRFDLSAVPGGVEIASATLKLYVSDWDPLIDNDVVRVHRVTAPWQEASATYANFHHAFDGAAEASFLASGVGHRTVDIAALAQRWVDGSAPNHGILLEETALLAARYASSESSHVDRRPELTVCYIPVCTPGSVDACYSGPPGTEGVGICAPGTRTCNGQGTGYGPCTGDVLPAAETCNTPVDDDCDGQINEEGEGCVCLPGSAAACYTGPEGTEGVGACAAGTKTCNDQGTAYGPCEGDVLPAAEACTDLADQDCDGWVNEGCQKLSAGLWHSLVVRPNSRVVAWGSNMFGQLGDGTLASSPSPVGVAYVSQVSTAGGGAWFSLAQRSSGALWAWGDNGYGEIGDGTIGSKPAPVPVPGLGEVVAVSLGPTANHALALRADGSVWGWGANYHGQVGDGSTATRRTPAQVLDAAVAVATGSGHSLAVRADGSVWSWGDNAHGELGDGAAASRATPGEIAGLGGALFAAAGSWVSLALREDGTVWAWGRNAEGQLGDGTTDDRATPAAVPGLSEVVAVAAGDAHALALRADGTVWAWGRNAEGQLGDGTTDSRATPAAVPGLSEVVAIAAGADHALALRADGTAWAWGRNAEGQLGDGTLTSSAAPVQVSLP